MIMLIEVTPDLITARITSINGRKRFEAVKRTYVVRSVVEKSTGFYGNGLVVYSIAENNVCHCDQR